MRTDSQPTRKSTTQRWILIGAIGIPALLLAPWVVRTRMNSLYEKVLPVVLKFVPPVEDIASLSPGGLEAKTDKVSELFGLSVMHTVDVTLAVKEWEALEETFVNRPGRGGPGGGLEVAESDYTRPEDGRLIHRGGGFGGFFPWTHAELRSGDLVLGDVGLRYKGNASYTASTNMMRRNLKIKTDLYGDEPTFHGEKTLNFNAGALDGSRVRESFSYAVFRAAGVPAPRTGFAEVSLTVPGLFDHEYLGVYTVVEQVNKRFAKDFLPSEGGLFMKPERATGGIGYLGDSWEPYVAVYRPDRDATPAEAQRMIDFARLVNVARDSDFRNRIESFVDVDEFFRFIAVNALLVNLDSFLGGRHNFIIYLNPSDNRFIFIPWDEDLSLAGYGGRGGGGGGSLVDYSVMIPNAGQNKLITRLLAIPEMKARYVALLRQITSTAFTHANLYRIIDTAENTTRASIKREAQAMALRGEMPRGAGGGLFGGINGPGIGRGPSPRTFVDERIQSVQRQLSGASRGTTRGG